MERTQRPTDAQRCRDAGKQKRSGEYRQFDQE